MNPFVDHKQHRILEAEKRAIAYLSKCGYRSATSLRGYLRWLLESALSGIPLVETRAARRSHLKGSGTSRKLARAALIEAGLIIVEQQGQFRRGRGTRIRLTPFFSRVAGV